MSNKILLVEDEALIAMSEAKMLEKHGYEVATVYNGKKAIEAVDSDSEISLILMDIDLGKGLDGTEAAQDILNRHDLPIVFLTSHSEREYVDRVKKITNYGYVLKNSGEFVLIESIYMAFTLFESKKNEEIHKNHLLAFINALPHLSFIFNKEGFILEVLTELEDFIYEDESFIVGKNVHEILPLSTADTIAECVRDTFESGKSQAVEYFLEVPAGGKWFEGRTSLIKGTEKIVFIAQNITERKQAEEESKENNRRLETLTKNLPGMAYRCWNDPRWTMKFVSEGAYELTEYTSVELQNNRIVAYGDLILSSESNQVWNKVREALVKKERFQVEYRIHTKSGKTKWVWEQGIGIYSDDNSLHHIEGFITDITERKQVEQNRQNNEERLRRTQKIAKVGNWELDLNTKYLCWSDEIFRIFGLTPQEFEATYEAFLNRVHPEDREKVNSAYWGSIKEGKDIYEVNHRIIRADNGETRYVHEKCEHIRDNSGEIIRSLGMVQDITEIKTTEKVLEESEERYRDIVENINVGLIIHDFDGIITFVNNTTCKMFNYTRDELIGKSIEDLHAYIYRDSLQDFIQNNTWSEINISDIELLSKDGNLVPAEVNTKIVSKEGTGKIQAVVRDINEHKQAEELLKKRNATLNKINQYSIELSFLRYVELYTYIVKKLKDIFKTSFALVSEYDENTSHMVVKSTSLSDKEGSWIMKKLGEKVIGHRAHINEEHYKMMKNIQVGTPQTLHEVSFGTIPQTIAKTIEKGLNLDWFMPVVFMDKDKITGAAVIAGKHGEEAPDREELLAFAGITGETIRRKRTEEELKEKKHLLQNITDNMTDLVSLTDKNGTFKYLSSSHNYLGYDADYLLGKNVFDFVHPEDINRIVASFTEVLHNSEILQRKEEYRYRSADGSYIWLETVGKKILKDTGEVKEIIFSSRDITKRKEVERENIERKQYVEAILNTTPGAIVTMNRDNRISEWNKGAEDLFGYTKEEVLGKNLDELIACKDEEIYKEATTLTNKTQYRDNIPPTEVIRYTKEGYPKDVIIAASPIMVDNTFQGSVGTYTDVTPLKQKQQEVNDLLQEKEQLLREVHHRIKNHMGTISAILSLRSSYSEDHRVSEVLEEVQNKIRLMQNIYQTLYTGDEVGIIDINSFLRQLLHDIQSTYIKEPSIQMEIDIEDVEVTSKQSLPIGIIVTELITNAIKYAFENQEEGTISISINKSDENWLRIQVSDNGAGIPDEIIENESYGFGLTLVDGYVRQFDGEMSIDNSNGTSIAVTMKLEE